ncbi:MAG TPA: hypothetical protein PKZ32_09135, partial [Candidatus Melainabacteria bacterium]|nr:hypothetical protein [Candidatus Melainabacteria bacterium]
MRVLKRHGFCLSFSLSILATTSVVPFPAAAQNVPVERAGRLLTPQMQAPSLPSPALRVRVAVAQNTRTPKDILAKLAKDESLTVRQAVAQNPSTPPEIIDELAGTTDEVIFEALLRNSRMPQPATLTKLTKAGIPKVLESIGSNPKTPPDVLHGLVMGPVHTEFLLLSLARNPNTPPDVVLRLCKIGDRLVRTFLSRQ